MADERSAAHGDEISIDPAASESGTAITPADDHAIAAE
jgi:hypothetical protein